MSEIMRIVRSTLFLDFVPRIGALVIRMLNQRADWWKILLQCKKAIRNYFQIYDKLATKSEIIEKILQRLG